MQGPFLSVKRRPFPPDKQAKQIGPRLHQLEKWMKNAALILQRQKL